MKTTEFHPRLQCGVDRIEYDFRSAKGSLHLRAGDCCDMKGCIELFAAIDPEVQAIDTFSGEKSDTRYWRQDGEWHAGHSC